MKSRIVKLISKSGLTVTSTRNFERLRGDSVNLESLSTWIAHENNSELIQFLSMNLRQSRAQNLQDLIALFHIGKIHPKKPGFFVEFGAADGMIGSNTLLLEKEYGWDGILAEPARIFHNNLRQLRTCNIDLRCVASRSGEVINFSESIEPRLSSIEGSGIERTKHLKSRTYQVDSVSLLDLLRTYNAPQEISFLTLDTEGSEYSILDNFPFHEYEIGLIAVEHNFRPDREEIFTLLTQNGFKRIYEFSGLQDDFYINKKLTKLD